MIAQIGLSTTTTTTTRLLRDIESNMSCAKSRLLTIFENVADEAARTMLVKKKYHLPCIFNKKCALNLNLTCFEQHYGRDT